MLKKIKRSISDCSNFVNVYSKRIDEMSKSQRSKLLSKQINIEANKQIDGVINEFVLKEGKVD